jgi:hypothetical protein
MASKGKRQVTLEITLDANGNIRIDIPHGKNKARDANAAADFTDKLSKAIGDVEERHIGDHHHHDHGTDHTHNHLTA